MDVEKFVKVFSQQYYAVMFLGLGKIKISLFLVQCNGVWQTDNWCVRATRNVFGEDI